MEDILSSIRRVIARDEAAARSRPLNARLRDSDAAALDAERAMCAHDHYHDDEAETPADDGPPEDVLELGPGDMQPPRDDAALLSAQSSHAARNALGSLTAAMTDDAAPAAASPGMSGTRVDDLVTAALRPMLSEWLDRNLPALVERMVAEEIARISARR